MRFIFTLRDLKDNHTEKVGDLINSDAKLSPCDFINCDPKMGVFIDSVAMLSPCDFINSDLNTVKPR